MQSDRRDRILGGASRAAHATDLFAGLSARLRRTVPFDAAAWRTTDPGTGLMTAPVLVENLDDDGCAVYWDSELLDEGVNRYPDLARAAVPAAALRDTTGDDPEVSALYRRHMRPRGLGDELRAVLRVDSRSWGAISLFREAGRPAFTPDDIAFVSALSRPLAARLREFARAASAAPAEDHGPGLLLFSPSGALLSANDEARRHLGTVPPGPSVTTALGLPLPAALYSVARRAFAAAGEGEGGSARIRIRTGSGTWLACHASCMRGPDGEPGQVALIVEPAKASEVTPLLIAAYRLSARESEITGCIARGLATGEIAARLNLSPHTVRDHVKAVFEKVGVSSRGELMARLHTDLYRPFTG
ncbi:helix-turn-helix transcriptional regulator [Actinomadura opuntiae]|uniref:helix-turn-helix transcriptional regulator n=1 Tax=Actinomadura sp. OS1-43 TaxID=604315 RepID=UPI00255A70EC|nr:helix-turn-helix transcriptional regulator [Actinomadura sp. OS1-43]MDL4816497.1 helix-turn-helix transcriptional regulator [Actinomadura sp. OS1-43]